MKSLYEKRKLATEWVNNADEAEIDALLQTVLWKEKPIYAPEVIHDLEHRWENYVSGKKEFTTPEKLREKLLKK